MRKLSLVLKRCAARVLGSFPAADRVGGTAIEFALIGGMTLTLIVGFADLGLILYNDANLHGSAQRAARAVRIARLEPAATQAAIFRTELCDGLVLIDCNQVEADLRRFGDLASVGALADVRDGTIQAPRFDTVGASDLIFVTLAYRHQLYTPLGALLASGVPDSSSQHLMVASVFTVAEG